MRFIYPIFMSFMISFMSVGFALKDYYVPNDGLYYEVMTYEKTVMGSDLGFINNRYKTWVVVLRREDGSEFRFSSNGYVVKHIRENLETGSKVEVAWFKPCHEVLYALPGSCIEVIAVNDMDPKISEKFYLKDRGDSFIFYSLIAFVLVSIFLLGMTVKEKDSNDVR